jgi:cell division protein FtsI/penicillin-binding protein 2
VFKLVTSAALLETAGVLPNDRVCISGGMRRIEREHLEPARGEGVQCDAFSQALGHSRNAVFAQLATTRLARSDLLQIAERLGFNGVVPFDWSVPVGHLQVPYNDLEFARTAAGFRGSTLSPLGGAYLASIVAEGGLSRRFHLNESDDDGADPSEQAPTRLLSAITAARLTRMMEVTTHSGTCRHIFNDEHGHAYLPNVRVAGKTGTLRPYSREETASWFIGFAPSRDPEIIVSVMLENGHIWRRKAAEVARDLLRFYFHRQGAPNITDPLEEPAHPSIDAHSPIARSR